MSSITPSKTTEEIKLSLEELIKKAGDLDMMPQVARKVIELVAKESSTAAQLATIIEKDPNITTRILKFRIRHFMGFVERSKQSNKQLSFSDLRV